MRLKHRSRIYRPIVVIRGLASAAITIVSAVTLADPAPENVVLKPILAWIQVNSWIIVLVSSVVVWLPSVLLHYLGHPKLTAVLNELIAHFHSRIFSNVEDHHANHRVTLFAHRQFSLAGFVRGCWPWSGWLVPVTRSGYASLRTRVRFRAGDDRSCVEGVAGRAWAAGTAVAIDLPAVTRDSPLEDLRAYAAATFVPAEWVEKDPPETRSIMGFAIPTAGGVPWGVLVVDSTNPDLNKGLVAQEFQNHGRVLSRIVEEL